MPEGGISLTALGPYDVKVSAVDNYNHWEQLYAANPDAIAMIGLCAPDVASLGKLNAAHGDKFVAGGYDYRRKSGGNQGRPRLCLAGTEPVVQGYLPVVLLVEAIKSKKPTPTGFYDSGTQIVTAGSVEMGARPAQSDLRGVEKLAADPRRRRPILQRLVEVGARRGRRLPAYRALKLDKSQ